ncbi:hypothetical protein FD754_024909, partial [Muntiacus muntjak]
SSPTSLVDSEVTQTPMTLRCSPESGHCSVYWYQQALGQGPQFLIQFFIRIDTRSELSLSSSELTDSTVYLCASSQDTALHDQVPLGQKHSSPAQDVGVRVLTVSQLGPSPVRADSLSQTFIS